MISLMYAGCVWDLSSRKKLFARGPGSTPLRDSFAQRALDDRARPRFVLDLHMRKSRKDGFEGVRKRSVPYIVEQSG